MRTKKSQNASARDSLDRAAVAERALALADAEGLDTLTIRRLAQDLGVTPMALYWHFSNKDELLDALAEHLFTDVRLPEAGGADWAAELRGALAALVASLRAHPNVAPLTQARVLRSRAGLAVAERALRLLSSAGFSAEQAAQIGGYLLSSAVTLVTAEPGSGHGPVSEARDDAVRSERATLLTLPPLEYPHIIASADPLTFCRNDEEYFSLGLDLLIAGVKGLMPVS